MQYLTLRKSRCWLISILYASLAIMSVLATVTATSFGAPGDLDPTFGNGGIVVTPVDNSALTNSPTSILVQPDGKIVVSGQVWMYDYDQCACYYPVTFFFMRYHPSGILDTLFGTNGKVVTQVTADSGVPGYDIALQPDGKIVSVGWKQSDFAINRYNSDGSLDTSFGTGGRVVTSIVDFIDVASNVAIQADGKIVVAGVYNNSVGNNIDLGYAFARYHPNGSLDTGFGTGGKVITPMGRLFCNLGAVLLQPEGKIIAVGDSTNGNRYTLVRYNADGSLDAGFGSNGIVTHFLNGYGNHRFNDAALQPDGKIIGAGRADSNTVIIRYNPNGSFDTSFGSNGVFLTEPGFFVGNSIALQPDGKIAAFGYSYPLDGGNTSFAIARLNPTGTPDTGFGNNGRVITPLGTNGDSADGAVQADGKILAFGSTSTPNDIDIAIVRYLGDSAVPRPALFDFDRDGRSDISVFRPSNSVWYLDRSTQGFGAVQFGLSSDQVTPADFDGDGKTDIAIYRAGTWWWMNSSDYVVSAVQFGLPDDLPVPSDYRGDGRDEIAVYRDGEWWMLDLWNNQASVVNFGLPGDKPVPADYDGDGRVDQAVYRNGEWHLKRSSQGYAVVPFGVPTDKPVPSDYDGDGKGDLAVYREGTWHILKSTGGYTAFQWGLSTDVPTPADYDGDGKTDAAVFRDGVWYVLKSTGGVAIQQFGLSGDKPLPSAYLP